MIQHQYIKDMTSFYSFPNDFELETISSQVVLDALTSRLLEQNQNNGEGNFTINQREKKRITYEVDDQTAIGETTGGAVEEGFSVRRKCGKRKIVRVGETDQVSGVGNGIPETDDQIEIPTLLLF